MMMMEDENYAYPLFLSLDFSPPLSEWRLNGVCEINVFVTFVLFLVTRYIGR